MPAYFPVELTFDFDALASQVSVPFPAMLDTTIGPEHPFLDYRLTALVTAPGQTTPKEIAGFFAGDGTEGDPCTGDIGAGRVWKLRFALENIPGTWTFQVHFEHGVGSDGLPINVSDDPVPSTSTGIVFSDIQAVYAQTLGYDPSAPGFRSKGFLRFDANEGTYNYKFSNAALLDSQRYFLKTGVDSPENLFAYEGFYKTRHNPSYHGVLHTYNVAAPGAMPALTHAANDWQLGDPEWVTTGYTWPSTLKHFCDPSCNLGINGLAGHGIIGALRYISSQGMNSIYFMPLNLGGDGRDVHPFADVPIADIGANDPSDCTKLMSYSIKRMQEWNTVIDFAQQQGILCHFVLHEQEPENVRWLRRDQFTCNVSANVMTWAQRLYLKQMVAYFGHHLAIKWNLCEENGKEGANPPNQQFTVAELEAMAGWIERWDKMGDHPISVHTHINETELYTQILAGATGGAWLDATSMQIIANEPIDPAQALDFAGDPHRYDIITEALRTQIFTPTTGSHRAVIDVDEQGSYSFGASGKNAMGQYGTIMSSAEGRRRLVLYDVLLSGGNIEWYCGHIQTVTYGGDDTTLEEYYSRSELWEYSKVAGDRLRMHPFWLGVPNDARVTTEIHDMNPSGTYGGAQVFENEDLNSPPSHNFHLIYYPDVPSTATSLGKVDMSYVPQAAPAYTYVGFFVNPLTGAVFNDSRTFFHPEDNSDHVPQLPPSWTPNTCPDLLYVIFRI